MPRRKTKSVDYEARLLARMRDAGLPEPRKQYRFHPTRQWRADFAWPDYGLIVEVEGGAWIGGRHVTGTGFEKDCIKYNHAILRGFQVMRVTPNMINKGMAVEQIREYFKQCGT